MVMQDAQDLGLRSVEFRGDLSGGKTLGLVQISPNLGFDEVQIEIEIEGIQ